MALEDKRIKVFHKGNGGSSSARNLGLSHAKGDFIGFVDSDDWVDLKMDELMYEKAIEEKADNALTKLSLNDLCGELPPR